MLVVRNECTACKSTDNARQSLQDVGRGSPRHQCQFGEVNPALRRDGQLFVGLTRFVSATSRKRVNNSGSVGELWICQFNAKVFTNNPAPLFEFC
jgi:hypothetical protein